MKSRNFNYLCGNDPHQLAVVFIITIFHISNFELLFQQFKLPEALFSLEVHLLPCTIILTSVLGDIYLNLALLICITLS